MIDRSVEVVAAAPIIAFIVAIITMTSMQTDKYKLYWFLHTLSFNLLFQMLAMAYFGRLIFGSESSSPKKETPEQGISEKSAEEMAQERAENFALGSMEKKSRSSAETTFENVN